MWLLFVVLLGIGVEPFGSAKHRICKGSMFMGVLSLLRRAVESWTSSKLEYSDG